MLLIAQNIVKEYGIQKILEFKKIEINDGDRIGLVGKNGAGKSTLLGILQGTIACEEGIVKRNCEVAVIPQLGEPERDADGMYLSRMRLSEGYVNSGGEMTRMAIASAFSRHAPLLFADEPTTNLDRQGIDQLEKMLKGYRGAVVLVSHDRALLDEVCNQIWEIGGGELRVFPGNYSAWLEQRQREREFAQFEFDQYRSEKKRLEQVVAQVRQEGRKVGKPPRGMSSSEWMLYKGTAAIQQAHVQNRGTALISRLNQLEKKERPSDLPQVSMKLSGADKIRNRYAARVEDFSFAYGDRTLFESANFLVEAGKKTFLTGENGSGKTTVLRCLLDKEPGTGLSGEARIGYFSQNLDTLNPDLTVIENVRRDAALGDHICRAVLSNLCLSREDMEKKAGVLSGGERVKTAMAKVLVSGCNFLILDEPTNHMDVYTMEGLEQLLRSYDGTMLAVSHDRKFMENLADEVYMLEEGKFIKI